MTKPKVRPGRCPKCSKSHEACADSKSCENWRISHAVCVTFGTRGPLKPDEEEYVQ